MNRQIKIFEELAKNFDTKREMVTAVANLLNVGHDAVYRRMRGDTILATEELLLLALRYNLDLNRISGQKYQAQYRPLIPIHINSELEYFQRLDKQQQYVRAMKDVSFYHVSAELPFPYEVAFPTLRSFKIFMYGITTWQLRKWEDKRYDPSLIDPLVHKLADSFVETSFSLPGKELFSASLLDVTLRQITYMAEVARFKNTNCINKLFDEIFLLIDHLEEITNSGRRFLPGKGPCEECPRHEVYLNELSSSNNLLLVESSPRSFQISMTISPNYITTDDAGVFLQSKSWFDTLIRNGTLLGNSSPKYTISFFNQLRHKTRRTQELLVPYTTGNSYFSSKW